MNARWLDVRRLRTTKKLGMEFLPEMWNVALIQAVLFNTQWLNKKQQRLLWHNFMLVKLGRELARSLNEMRRFWTPSKTSTLQILESFSTWTTLFMYMAERMGVSNYAMILLSLFEQLNETHKNINHLPLKTYLTSTPLHFLLLSMISFKRSMAF